MAVTIYPKQMIMANTFYMPYASFSSFSDMILTSPAVEKSMVIQPAVMMGDIPNSMSVPLLEAMMTLMRCRGSA